MEKNSLEEYIEMQEYRQQLIARKKATKMQRSANRRAKEERQNSDGE